MEERLPDEPRDITSAAVSDLQALGSQPDECTLKPNAHTRSICLG